MNKINLFLNKEQFEAVLKSVHTNQEVNVEALYLVYARCLDAIQEIQNNGIFRELPVFDAVELIYYLVGEYGYISKVTPPELLKQRFANPKFVDTLATVVADKYVSLSTFNHTEARMISRFMPPISSLNLYLNFILNILSNQKGKDPKKTLIKDLLEKSTSLARVTLSLLTQGYETEALSTWRTLHECECALVVLEKYGDPIINRYLIHMQYGIVFRKNDQTSEVGNKIFQNMKEEMAVRGLKSKDIKKYIEYGWLYEVPGVKEDPTFKLNFREGLEKVAGLETNNTRYELASETVHVTPLLIYSNKEYLYYLTLLSLYESFFRLERIFINLFSQYVSQEYLDKYGELRNVYYQQLEDIYKRESINFKLWKEKNKGEH